MWSTSASWELTGGGTGETGGSGRIGDSSGCGVGQEPAWDLIPTRAPATAEAIKMAQNAVQLNDLPTLALVAAPTKKPSSRPMNPPMSAVPTALSTRSPS